MSSEPSLREFTISRTFDAPRAKNPAKRERAWNTMIKMVKLDINKLRQAVNKKQPNQEKPC